ncbi:hypothetical protein ABK040_001937 [Willaertia magna]
MRARRRQVQANTNNSPFIPTQHYELIPPVLCNLFKSNINNENLNDFMLIQQNLSNLKSFFSTTDVNLPPLDVQEEIFKQILDIYALQLDLEIKLLPKQLNACHFYILKLINYLPKFLYFENRSELFCGYNPNSKDPENRNVLNKFKFKNYKEFNWIYHIFNNLNYDTSLKLLEYYCNLYYIDLKQLFNRELLNLDLMKTRSNIDDGKKIRIENSLLKNYFNIYTNSEKDLIEFILDYFNYLSTISKNDDIELKLRNLSLLVKSIICVTSLHFEYDYGMASYKRIPFVTMLFENFDYNDEIVTQIKNYILQMSFNPEGDDKYNYYILNDSLLTNWDKLFFLYYLIQKCLHSNVSLVFKRTNNFTNNFKTIIGIKFKKLKSKTPVSYFLTLMELVMKIYNESEIGETIMKEERTFKKEKKQFVEFLESLIEEEELQQKREDDDDCRDNKEKKGDSLEYEKTKLASIKGYLGMKEEEEEIFVVAGGEYEEDENSKENETMEKKETTTEKKEEELKKENEKVEEEQKVVKKRKRVFRRTSK